METVLTSITKFLNHHRERGIAPDLLARYTPDMEVQVLVGSANGSPVEGKQGCYTDGKNTWWNIRVPKNADSEPELNNYRLDWPLDLYADAIGCTGWDYAARVSRWVGFDFDAIVGHAAGVGVGEDELAQVREKACALPYIEVRRSTGGLGLHLYAHLDAIPTENHTVHAGLARCILGLMSTATGFDFASRIDCLGGNMWVWRRNLEPDHPGLSLIKEATHCLTLSDLPSNWRDHIEVIKKKGGKVAGDKSLVDVASAMKDVPLDEEHKKLIEALNDSAFATNWMSDYHCLHTKTKALQDIFESQVIPIKGVFRTVSEGNNPGEPNCYMFPMEGGGWRVYRFNNAAEADTWTKDSNGRTTCLFNRRATLKTAALFYGGAEDANGEFVFTTPDAAIETARCLGETLRLPAEAQGREIRLGKSKDGHLEVKLSKAKEDSDLGGWITKTKHYYKRLQSPLEEAKEDVFSQYDDVFRKLSSVSDGDAGWMIRNESVWIDCPKDDVKNRLESLGVQKSEINSLLGHAVYKPWKLVNLPFQPEYPGGRQWNHGAAQLAYEPADLAEDETPYHPHWDLILTHCGRDLDFEIEGLEWCREDRIFNGADYLRTWLACMFRCPFEPLPYLFFFGDQNAGKSIFHEAASLLMTAGYVIADKALTNRNDFNGELANAILCVVEEKNISKSPGAYAKIKEWVTAKWISIRRMRTDAYMQPNMTKWVQCANFRSDCCIMPGDTRIVVIFVRLPETEIPKEELQARLREEAPHFMRTMMNMELPKRRGRLRLPVIETLNKRIEEERNQDPLVTFLAEKIETADGEKIPFSEFYKKFEETLDNDERPSWSKKYVSQHLPHHHRTDRSTNGVVCISNAKWKTA
jgi:hypothetical protein